jgi:hypothetical protein
MSLPIPNWVSTKRFANKARMVTTAMRTKMMAMVCMAVMAMMAATRTTVDCFFALVSITFKIFFHVKGLLSFQYIIYNM